MPTSLLARAQRVSYRFTLPSYAKMCIVKRPRGLASDKAKRCGTHEGSFIRCTYVEATMSARPLVRQTCLIELFDFASLRRNFFRLYQHEQNKASAVP